MTANEFTENLQKVIAEQLNIHLADLTAMERANRLIQGEQDKILKTLDDQSSSNQDREISDQIDELESVVKNLLEQAIQIKHALTRCEKFE